MVSYVSLAMDWDEAEKVRDTMLRSSGLPKSSRQAEEPERYASRTPWSSAPASASTLST